MELSLALASHDRSLVASVAESSRFRSDPRALAGVAQCAAAFRAAASLSPLCSVDVPRGIVAPFSLPLLLRDALLIAASPACVVQLSSAGSEDARSRIGGGGGVTIVELPAAWAEDESTAKSTALL